MSADDLKTYYPQVIQDAPFPEEQGEGIAASAADGGVLSPTTIKEKSFPKRVIARETISSSLNTLSRKILGAFEFVQQGALQIGKYLSGVSGDIRLTPDGITARNKDGDTTFAIDGATGDATFLGTIQAGSVIADSVLADFIQVGGAADDVNSGTTTIDGGKLTTGTVTADYVVASISITSPTISGGSIAIGSANSIFKADSNGIYLGNATFASAPFNVSMAGAVNSSNLTVTGGTITGTTIRTAGSGGRLEMKADIVSSNDGLIFYDSSGGIDAYIYNDTSGNLVLDTGSVICEGDLRVYSEISSEIGSVVLIGDSVAVTLDNTDFYGNQVWYWDLNYWSDEKLKKNIKEHPNNLVDIMKFKPIEFEYISDKKNIKRLGFSAQEVERILPNLVVTGRKGMKGIRMSEMIPMLIGSVQELQTEISLLKSKIV